MRWLLVLLAAPGCLRVSEDHDGRWTSLEEPCVPLGDAEVLAKIHGSVWLVPAGNTLLMTAGSDVLQVSVPGGDSQIVVRGEGVGGLGVFHDQIIHYESGNTGFGAGIDIIVDKGRGSSERYRRLSLRRGEEHAGLIVTPVGAVWASFATDDETGESATHWRWNPATDQTTQLMIDPRSGVANDDHAIAYFDTANSTVIYPLDEVPHVLGGNSSTETLTPIAIRGGEMLFTHDVATAIETTIEAPMRELMLGTSLDSAITLVSRRAIGDVVLAADGVYFTDTSASNRISRVDLTSHEITTFYESATANPFGLAADACNVYWQEISFEQGAFGDVVGASLNRRR